MGINQKDLLQLSHHIESYLVSENEMREHLKAIKKLFDDNRIIGITALTEEQAKKIKDLED
mgnify:CR=1 FL=1